DNIAILDRVRKLAIPPASRFRAEVTSQLDDILFKALERDPSKRWQNAASMRAALAAHTREFPPLTKSQLVTWVEWAFSQTLKMREDSGLSALHDIIETGPVQVQELDAAEDIKSVSVRLPATSAAMMERQRESVAAMPVRRAVLPRYHGRDLARWLWLLGLG